MSLFIRDHLDISQFDALVKTLETNTNYTEVLFIKNKFEPSQLQTLITIFKSDTVITNLTICLNIINIEVAHTIAEMIRVNKTITHLELPMTVPPGSCNGSLPSDANCAKIVQIYHDALTTNTTITHFDVGENRTYDDYGIDSLKSLFATNKTLLAVNYRAVYESTGVTALVQALSLNKSITDVNVSNVVIHEHDKETITRCIEENLNLLKFKIEIRDNEKRIRIDNAIARNVTIDLILQQLYQWYNTDSIMDYNLAQQMLLFQPFIEKKIANNNYSITIQKILKKYHLDLIIKIGPDTFFGNLPLDIICLIFSFIDLENINRLYAIFYNLI